MTTRSDQALDMFSQGFNCAQCVLVACGVPRGIPRDVAIRIACPFAGGMGLTGETCGAVAGALMVIGLQHAKADPTDAPAKQKTHRLAQQFLAEFKQRHQSTCCRELIGCDISTPQNMQKAKDAKIFSTICPPLVKSAADILEQLLASEKT